MSSVAFIIGAGPGVGITVARRFAKEGYKVAIASRNPDVESAKKEGLLAVKLDASDAASITAAFENVEKELGPSNVVVWNAGNDSPLPVEGDSLSLSVEEWQKGISTATNFFVIAKHAVEGFRKVSSGPKVLISTGNIGPWMQPWTRFFAIQVQKKLIASLVEDFVSRYEKDGQRFYFASQVTQEQTPLFKIDADAHATAYLRFATSPEQLQWEQRFIEDGKEHNVKHYIKGSMAGL